MLEHLQDPIHRAMQASGVPGLAVALLEEGELTGVTGFGVRRYGYPKPVTKDTIFPAASVTKPIFAYAVFKLVEGGVLDLDTPLNRYLPQPYLPSEAQAAHITARHVLSHQSGFPNWRAEGEALHMKWPLGTHFNYSGEGFLYLQKVVEHITKERLDIHLQEQVFNPLNMRNSTLVWQPFIKERAAWGYDDNKNWKMPKEDLPNSAYSLYTTAEDLAYFLQALIADKPEERTGTGLGDSSIEQMLTSQLKVGDWPDLFWGLGWGIQRTEVCNLFWHWGAAAGFRHYVAGSREHQVGIVILTNYEDGLQACKEIISCLDNPYLSVSHPAFDWLLHNDGWREDGRIIQQKS